MTNAYAAEIFGIHILLALRKAVPKDLGQLLSPSRRKFIFTNSIFSSENIPKTEIPSNLPILEMLQKLYVCLSTSNGHCSMTTSLYWLKFYVDDNRDSKFYLVIVSRDIT